MTQTINVLSEILQSIEEKIARYDVEHPAVSRVLEGIKEEIEEKKREAEAEAARKQAEAQEKARREEAATAQAMWDDLIER